MRRAATWTFISLIVFGSIATGASCQKPDACVTVVPSPSPLASTASLSSGGLKIQMANATIDTPDTFEAVGCEGGGKNADGTTNPCASGTLVAPRWFLTAHHVGDGVGRNVWFGVNARDNPDFGASVIACYEFRGSGAEHCCMHVPPSDPTYAQYLKTCPKPLAPNDYLATDAVLWELNRDVVEVQPIPIAITTPKGTHDLNDLNGVQSVIVGYGSTDGGCYATPTTKSGTRRYGGMIIGPPTEDYYPLNGAGNNAGYIPSFLTGEYNTSWAYLEPGDSGGPVLVNYGAQPANGQCSPLSQFKVVGVATQACNYSFGSTVYGPVAAGIVQVLGPDLDGIGGIDPEPAPSASPAPGVSPRP
jgi:hypothetical protein